MTTTAAISSDAGARRNRLINAAICFALIAGIWLVYGHVAGYNFFALGDLNYVVSNPHVRAGITGEGLKWAFRSVESGGWTPLGWISHMVDCQIFGLRPGWHHAVNLLLHCANACLLFLFFVKTTGRRACSFLVAAFFAWHPLRVETVTWISERKDLLGAFLFLLTLIAYARFAQAGRAKRWFAAAIVLFLLCLMSNPLLATLPIVLLLVDYWPLHRSRQTAWMRLVLEKWPFFVMAAAAFGATMWIQSSSALWSTKIPSWPDRLGFVVLSYFQYLEQTLWPVNLAMPYPSMNVDLNWAVFVGAAVLIAATVGAFYTRKLPFVTMGWLWFIGMLAPVMIFILARLGSVADSYTYLASIGMVILIVNGFAELVARVPDLKRPLGVVTGVVLLACLGVSFRQSLFWQNSKYLLLHTVTVTSRNAGAYDLLGTAYRADGEIGPAIEAYTVSAFFDTNSSSTHAKLGDCYLQLKMPREALAELQTAVKLAPHSPVPHWFLADAYLALTNRAEAIREYEAGLALNPDNPLAHHHLASLLGSKGDAADAIVHYREALRLDPNSAGVLNDFAWMLATTPDARYRNGVEALRMAQRALSLSATNNPASLDTLAAAYAENGQFNQAVQAAGMAVQQARAKKLTNIVEQLESRLRLYQKSQPYRQKR